MLDRLRYISKEEKVVVIRLERDERDAVIRNISDDGEHHTSRCSYAQTCGHRLRDLRSLHEL